MVFIGSSTRQALATCILLAIGTVACVKVYQEHKSMEGRITSLSTLSEHDLKTERTMCARLCNRNGKCVSYFENSAAKQCRLVQSLHHADSEHLDKAPGWRYYARTHCDQETVAKGYYFDTETSLCFTYIKYSMTIPAAKKRCAEDGGRLLEIRNHRHQLALVKYLKSMGKTQFNTQYGPTISGHRADTNSAWLFDDGTPLTYFNWKKDAKREEIGRHCIRVYPRDEWTTANCTRNEPFMCQIP